MIQDEIVIGPEAGQVQIHVGRADIDGRRLIVVEVREDAVEVLDERAAIRFEIEPRGVLRVAEAAFQLRPCDEGEDLASLVEGLEILGCLRGRAGARERPVARHAPEDRRPFRRHELVLWDRVRGDALDYSRLAGRLRHRVRSGWLPASGS